MNAIGSAFRRRPGGLKVLLVMGGVLALGLMPIKSAWGVTLVNDEQKLLASDGAAHDYFGKSVSVSGDVALVGAYSHDDLGNYSGSAYVFNVIINCGDLICDLNGDRIIDRAVINIIRSHINQPASVCPE